MQHKRLLVLSFYRIDYLCSRSVPRVAATRACVSPRVNKAEPWALGNTPTSTLISLTVAVSLPSMRGSPATIAPLTILLSRSATASPIVRSLQRSLVLGGNRSDCLGLYFGQPLAPADFVLDCIGFAQQVRAQVANLVLHSLSSSAGCQSQG